MIEIRAGLRVALQQHRILKSQLFRVNVRFLCDVVRFIQRQITDSCATSSGRRCRTDLPCQATQQSFPVVRKQFRPNHVELAPLMFACAGGPALFFFWARLHPFSPQISVPRPNSLSPHPWQSHTLAIAQFDSRARRLS